MRSARYEDLLDRPHPSSETHPPMSRSMRAAQFSPFSALIGYEDAIRETARLTDQRITLDESIWEELNGTLSLLQQKLASGMRPHVTICFFQPDAQKDGGAYQTISGDVRSLDPHEAYLQLTTGIRIPLREILSVACEETE